MRVIHQSRLKHLKLTFATGDIFDAPVEAIVNSEQTDFKLSRNRNSLSGQIWFRYGEIVQRELDLVTEGQVLGPGTVIETTGGQDFKRIFHAGFHYPSGWPNLPRLLAPVEQGDTRQTEYFEAIGSCVTQILNIAEGVKVKSIAFPLIGCGIFGLDEKMLILQFLDSLEEAGARLADAELNVWLVIRDPDQFESAAGAFLDLLLRSRHEMVQVQLESTGVTLLDRFAARISAPTHKDWAKWQLCRYAEVAVQFMYYGINRGIHPPISPLSVFKPNHPWTFGHVLDKATTLALSKRSAKKSWGAFFFAGVLEEPKSAYALDQLRSHGFKNC
jgi:O-acetyl-ADP-ribose deacetylase (regulator of RNase III)